MYKGWRWGQGGRVWTDLWNPQRLEGIEGKRHNILHNMEIFNVYWSIIWYDRHNKNSYRNGGLEAEPPNNSLNIIKYLHHRKKWLLKTRWVFKTWKSVWVGYFATEFSIFRAILYCTFTLTLLWLRITFWMSSFWLTGWILYARFTAENEI